MNAPDLQPLLEYIRKHFYRQPPKTRYYEDRKMLLYALTWPAARLAGRSLRIQSDHYNRILFERLRQIQRHGDPQTYQRYFPRYLLKVLQDWFRHHGDSLYDELKHASYTLDWLVKTIENRPPPSSNAEAEHTVEILAQSHRILRPQRRKKTALESARQTELFE